MGEIEYRLNFTDDDRAKIRFVTIKGKVRYFLVQYEATIQGKWKPVIRYDVAHGFIHADIMHRDGTAEKRKLFFPDYEEALTYSIRDIKENWERYRERYERG